MWRRVWLVRRKDARRAHWSVRWIDESGCQRTRAASDDRRIAEELRRRKEAEINGEAHFGDVRPITLQAFLEEHVEMLVGARQPGTIIEHRACLERLVAFFGAERRLDRLETRDVEAYLAARRGTWRLRWHEGQRPRRRDVGRDQASAEAARAALEAELKRRVVLDAPCSPATANKDLRTARAIFASALRRRYVKANPFDAMRPVREVRREVRMLSPEEVAALLAACRSDSWRAFLVLALTTGMRTGELCALEWSDVDFGRGLVHVRCKPGHRTKAARDRIGPLAPAAAARLQAMASERTQASAGLVFVGPRGSWAGNLRRGFARLCERAGVADCSPHDLRRTFVSALAAADVNQVKVQRLAGHQSAATTERYYTGVGMESMREAVARLPWAG